MKMRVVAVALSMILAAVPAKAAEFITYQGFSSGTVTFFDNFSPNPPITKVTGYTFTFIAPLNPSVDPRATITGSTLTLSTLGEFNYFQAVACLAQSPNGQFPTSDPALVPGCGSVFSYRGKNSGFTFSGNLFELRAQALSGTPERAGLVGDAFFDLPAPPIPEPATWFMMLLGIGMIGGAMRKRMRAPYAVR